MYVLKIDWIFEAYRIEIILIEDAYLYLKERGS